MDGCSLILGDRESVLLSDTRSRGDCGYPKYCLVHQHPNAPKSSGTGCEIVPYAR